MKNPPFDSLVWGSLRLAPIKLKYYLNGAILRITKDVLKYRPVGTSLDLDIMYCALISN